MHIFISYSRTDEDTVKQIVEDCKSLGYEVWFDRELSGGQSWWDRILSEIRKCDLFLFVLSKKSNNSTACSREYNYAHQLNKRILPVLVDDMSTNLLPPALTAIHYVDYRNKDRNSLIDLVKAFNSLPEPSALPEPLPEPPEVPISYLGNLKKEIETSQVLSFEDQSAILLKLKERMKNQAEVKDVQELLRKFKQRDELYHRIAEQIDELLGGRRPETLSTPEPERKNPGPQKTQGQHRQAQAAFQTASRPQHNPTAAAPQTDWMGIVGIVGGIFIPVVGIGLGIWSLVRINQNPQKLKGRAFGWIAIGLSLIVAFIYLLGIFANMASDPYYSPYGY